jgi:hypothetical protein
LACDQIESSGPSGGDSSFDNKHKADSGAEEPSLEDVEQLAKKPDRGKKEKVAASHAGLPDIDGGIAGDE